jgi:hypothetical protein
MADAVDRPQLALLIHWRIDRPAGLGETAGRPWPDGPDAKRPDNGQTLTERWLTYQPAGEAVQVADRRAAPFLGLRGQATAALVGWRGTPRRRHHSRGPALGRA